MPAAPFKGAFDKPFLARNSSLHPFITVQASTNEKAPMWGEMNAQQKRLNDILAAKQDTTGNFICIPHYNCFGDIFTLNSDAFREVARGKTPVLGCVDIQFGRINNESLPYVMSPGAWSEPFAAKLKKILSFLPPGTKAGMAGIRGILDFASVKHIQSNLSINGDAQKISIGNINLLGEDGRHELIIRAYFFLDVLAKLMIIEPRTPTDSFAFVSEASFTTTTDGFLIYQTTGSVHIPYPEGYKFPLPNGRGAKVGPGSFLLPFFNICAIEKKAFHKAKVQGISLHSHEVLRGVCDKVFIKNEPLEDNIVQWIITKDKKAFNGQSSNMADEVVDALGFEKIWFIEIDFPAFKTVLFFHKNANEHFITAISTDDNFSFWIRV